ncbi:MAG: divalent-cation tolerance protein CutA [Deltaproteobacteria bacterium]|nr:divalent-cation tolerance protein CutA [Deltaproteobacteria bacterium]
MIELNDDDVVVVLCTVPAEGGHAERLARGVVEAKLAACVNVLGPIRSIYEWKGSVAEESELQLVVKTTAERYPALEAHLRREHPYEVPEVLALPVARGAGAYLEWVRAGTRP